MGFFTKFDCFVEKLKSILNIDNSLTWNDIAEKEVLLAENHQINKAELLFSKIEDVTIQKQLDKLEATKKANEAEKVAKVKKLLKLKVDVGMDVRTIVSGIAESFKPEDIVGQQVTVLCNLAPRKIRGVESQGMILMTDTPDGKLAFVQPSEKVNNGEFIA